MSVGDIKSIMARTLIVVRSEHYGGCEPNRQNHRATCYRSVPPSLLTARPQISPFPNAPKALHITLSRPSFRLTAAQQLPPARLCVLLPPQKAFSHTYNNRQ